MRRFSTRRASWLLCLLILVGSPSLEGKKKDPFKDQLDFGVDMAQRGLWNEALFRFQQAKKLNPQSASVYNNLAVANEALGRFEQALEHYQKALELDPSDRNLKRNYSRFVEFYQSFKPPEEEEAEAGEETEAETQAAAERDGSTP